MKNVIKDKHGSGVYRITDTTGRLSFVELINPKTFHYATGGRREALKFMFDWQIEELDESRMNSYFGMGDTLPVRNEA